MRTLPHTDKYRQCLFLALALVSLMGKFILFFQKESLCAHLEGEILQEGTVDDILKVHSNDRKFVLK
jgi:hypothetical protein